MQLEKLARFAEVAGKLKRTKRSGWISQVGIENPESVADHTFRCVLLGMIVGDLAKADTARLMRMLLLHDIQETCTGDLDAQAKRQLDVGKLKARQKFAMAEILSVLPPTLKGNYLSLWKEFEKGGTREAVLANDIDKLEMAIQALAYEKEGHEPSKLEPFWESSRSAIKTPLVLDLYRVFVKMRARHHDVHPPSQR